MYKFKSLGIETNILMDSFLANVIEKDDYIVVQTPKRPNYFWGNYILMKEPPCKGDFKEWVSIFEAEIGERRVKGFCAMTFDLATNENFDVSDFLENGFKVEVDKILTTNKVVEPIKFNSKLTIKEYDLSKNIESYVEVHFDENWAYGSEDKQKEFLREQAMDFSTLIDKKVARRFGGYLNGKLVTDLGVYWNDNVTRFNSISTHPSFRRLGACSTLVYKVSKDLLIQNPSKTLVMQADEDYHAALIYESIGFEPKEKVIAIEWTDDSRFGNF